ncbi:NFACT RNA binding domain-containing protein [Fodinibius sediminis]|uniref:Predicted component of the ribosome quality control (RQC) complex, YloA/Tae2 family, contains fibronectin-binding (FbpA) and DUF814 domains n=1 Tax=Fodinibius sediminis TaxID=1214077 RepID=A0A521D0T1_9BACT|nr:NFACT RNA binding domain-containing protein [Fodinibius sediminis]SMO65305.1 Predicted component of the ribosome quality control (RQC) complex, YloA/Tae2 family, contains fibronectin-binding (FbpA) and DUF814 domains [Fodinibius sediminis]
MNNFYTLIYLNREIKEKIQNGIFSFGISPHKDVLHIYIESDKETSRLIFSANARETALFLDRYRPPKKRNVIDFFPSLEGARVVDTSLADKDRLLSIIFEGGRSLLFKLFSGRPNVFLVEGDRIVDAFKNPEDLKGTSPPEPMAPVFKEEVSAGRNAKNQMTEINPLLPRNLLPYIIEEHEVEQMSPGKVKTFTRELSRSLLEEPHPRVLETGDFCLWSQKWLSLPSEKECETVNDCVAFAYKNAVHLRRLHSKKEDIVQFLERVEGKKKEMVRQLSQAEKSLNRADEYEKFGHLLMAHAHEQLTPGTEQITVEDFYENNDEITIPLKEQADIAGNAERYYEKAKDARKAYEEAKKRLPGEEKELLHVQSLLEEVREIDRLWDLDSWLKNNSESLNKLGFGSSDDKQLSSPYRKFKLGKYEVWIGKNAKSNDKLTSLAHKEDIWLHARGVGGSHTVIRMGNRKDYPPKRVLLQAAAYAAYYSKARGMKSVPVMYTKCKYVRKPKGGAPGAVVLEREEVEMVPPMNPNNQ